MRCHEPTPGRTAGRRSGSAWPAAGLLSLILGGGVAVGFHDGNVAHCDSCHVSHTSEDGMPLPTPVTGELLRGATPSEICLTCHADNQGRVMGGSPQSPPPEMGAGNFVFLLEDNLNDGPDGLVNPISGDAAGHNLVAPSYGLVSDSRHTVAPGGGYPADRLGCTSCHDPHGGGKYRLLYDVGTTEGGRFNFIYPPPTAVGIDLDGPAESPGNHNAYQGGMSAWCGNCHGPRYHDTHPTARFTGHPDRQPLPGPVRTRYGLYDGDSNPLGGTPALAYLPQVPYETLSMTTTTTSGPSGGARLMCLTCHRAHASSAPAAGRWDFNVSVLSEDGLVSGSYPIPDPYQDLAQGQLCHKCHEGDFTGN